MKKIILFVVLLITMLCSCDPDSFRQKCNSDSLEYRSMVEAFVRSIEPFSCPIAFYGDSRVIGADWNSAFEGTDLINLGIGGDKVEDLLYRLCVIDVLEIEKCFVAIGGNNALSSYFSATDFREKYETLICELQSRGITVYLNTVAPITNVSNNLKESEVKAKNKKINTVNTIIRELATDYNTTLIDIAMEMTDSNGKLIESYSSDGIHFTQLGNEVWFNKVRPYL